MALQRECKQPSFSGLTVDILIRITSYINNLHPSKHQRLYKIIDDIITKAVPLWNMTLSALTDRNTPRRIEYHVALYDPDPKNIPREDQPQQETGEADDDYDERLGVWTDDTRVVVQPEPELFRSPTVLRWYKLPGYYVNSKFDKNIPRPEFDIKRDYSGRGLQVIVKLANIHLTPANPHYQGGSWHVEGQMNEHICATALYYYDGENITDSHLAFRYSSAIHCTESVKYSQDIHDWLPKLFGCEQEGYSVQTVGSVLCDEGRLLKFSNTLQHQLQGFKLADPTKPGHRKIPAFFLVDPGIRIISTANVPLQQRDWSKNSCSHDMDEEASSGYKDGVTEKVGGSAISLEEAKELRLKLMAERSAFVSAYEVNFEQPSMTFNLCEH
jgi:hypothetical protein